MIIDSLRAIHPTDIQFDGHWVTEKADGGPPRVRMAWTGMPRVPDQVLHATFFLYGTVEDARAGVNVRGSGFFVGTKLSRRPGYSVVYAVSNWHVAVRGGSVIRFNRTDGGVEIIDRGPEDWVFDGGGHDIAITPVGGWGFDLHEVRFIDSVALLTEGKVADWGIGPGEDVFMVGLLVDAQGRERNEPAVRFGNISIMPTPIKNGLHATVPTYCLDMHSRSGFSGSPIWVYRNFGQSLVHNNLDMKDQFTALLGIHYGQFPEEWEIVKRKGAAPKSEGVEVEWDPDSTYVKGMSGMTLVAPASAIIDLLEHPKLKEWYDKYNNEIPAVDFAEPVPE